MTGEGSAPDEVRADVQPTLGEDLRRAAPVAVRGGALAAAAAIVMGQLPPLALNLFGGGLAVSTQVRLGWLYTAASNVIAIRIGEFGETDAGLQRFGTATLRIAALTLTVVLGWLLVRAGVAAARRVSDAPGRRAAAGALVAPSYAAILGIVGLIVELRLETDGAFLPDVTTFRAVPLEAFAFPFVFAAVAGAAGGLGSGTRIGSRTWDALAGGWRALVWSIALALVGLLAFAVVRPSGLEGYVHELRSLGGRGSALAVGHQALLAPNHAVLVLVPAIGACDTVSGPDQTSDVLCLDRQPAVESPADVLTSAVGGQPIPTRPMPVAAKLFLLVPLVALVQGARRGSVHATSSVDAMVRGASAGVVYAVLIVVAVWASTATIEAIVDADARASVRFALGAAPLEAGLVALAWGVVVGGVAGGVTWAVRARRSTRV